MNEMTGERERAQIDDQRPIILKFILIIDCIIWTHDILINGFSCLMHVICLFECGNNDSKMPNNKRVR